LKKIIAAITGLFFIGYALIIFSTFQDYGITWDEEVHNEYGKRVVRYYSSGMTDGSAFKLRNLRLYGGWFDGTADLLKRISPFGEYETRHLFNAAVGFFGVVGVFYFAHYLTGSPAMGLLAAILLVLTPRYYGHTFNNPKDVPFAVFYLWSIYLIAKASERWRSGKTSKKADWVLGLVIGTCMGTRPPGLVIMFYLGLVFLAVRKMNRAKSQSSSPLIQSAKTKLLRPIIVAVATMFVFWPYSHLNPFGNILYALKMVSDFPWNFPLMFDGREIRATEIPWNYILKWYGITMPLPQLGGFFLFLIFWLLRVFRSQDEAFISLNLVFFSMGFPLAWAIATNATLYDGLRHFLFLAPLMAVAAAWGIFQFHRSLRIGFHLSGKKELVLGIGLMAVVSSGLISVVKWNIHSHPQQYTYFNQTIGGIRGAFGKYELEYFGSSDRQAALWLNSYIEKQKLGRKILVCSYSTPAQTKYYLNTKYFIYNPEKKDTKNCDVFIANLRWGVAPKGEVIHAFSIDGVPLVYIVLNNNRLKVQPN
tara:strand:- start:4889 stop:6490 length:1602 start_codon:yes stop_codon:yes gene_type:complete